VANLLSGIGLRRQCLLAFCVGVWIAVALTPQLSNVYSAGFSEPFSNLDNWAVYRGSNQQQLLDNSFGIPDPPSLDLLPAGSPLSPDPPGFGDNVFSLFLKNPDTSHLSNFTLDFWIYFDAEAGRCIVTFRMQDDRNYYALLLSDTHDWSSQFLKFTNAASSILASTPEGLFAPKQRTKVTLIVQGQSFTLRKDGETVLTASDAQWSGGRVLGIGFYNGYDYFHMHVDTVDLLTSEPLNYVQMITERTSTTTTASATVIETSTSVLVATTRSITSNQTIPHPVVADVTVNRTKIVDLLMPAVDFTSGLEIFGVGALIGVIFYPVRKGGLSVVLSLVSAVAALILTTYWIHLDVASLPILVLFLLGALIGCGIRKVTSGRTRWRQEG
jgi:hypothetical protein